VCAYHYVQLSHTTQHRTILIIFPCPPDNHHSSGDIHWRGGQWRKKNNIRDQLHASKFQVQNKTSDRLTWLSNFHTFSLEMLIRRFRADIQPLHTFTRQLVLDNAPITTSSSIFCLTSLLFSSRVTPGGPSPQRRKQKILFTGRMPFCHPTNSFEAMKEIVCR